MKGLKRGDIKKCCGCGRGVMHGGGLMLFRLSAEQHLIDPSAVHRAAGLEAMISPALAAVMGPDEDLTRGIAQQRDALVCQECATTRPLLELMGSAGAEAEEEEGG